MKEHEKDIIWSEDYSSSLWEWEEEGMAIHDLTQMLTRFESLGDLNRGELMLVTKLLKGVIYDANGDTHKISSKNELNARLLLWYRHENLYGEVYDTFNKIKRDDLHLLSVEELIMLLADCYKLLFPNNKIIFK